jgi:hypothetical protein
VNNGGAVPAGVLTGSAADGAVEGLNDIDGLRAGCLDGAAVLGCLVGAGVVGERVVSGDLDGMLVTGDEDGVIEGLEDIDGLRAGSLDGAAVLGCLVGAGVVGERVVSGDMMGSSMAVVGQNIKDVEVGGGTGAGVTGESVKQDGRASLLISQIPSMTNSSKDDTLV